MMDIKSKRLPWKHWSVIRDLVLERDSYVCSYCCDPADEVDHVTPHSRGGSDEMNNLLAACKRCNSSKGALLPEEWASRDEMVFPYWWNRNILPGADER